MPSGDIKVTLKVDGEQAFDRAIKSAQNSMRNMGTQLTLASAQFQRNGNVMQLVRSRSEALKQEIAQQQKIVNALAGAVQQASDAYGDGSDQAEKYQAELNRARAYLLMMEQELENNNSGLDRNGRAFDSAGKNAKNFKDAVSSLRFLSVDAAIDNTTNAIRGLFSALGSAGRFVWDHVANSGEWAKDLKTLSEQTGVSVTDLQKWNRAAGQAGVEVETITGSFKRLNNPSKEVTAALRELGVYTRDLEKEGIYWNSRANGPDFDPSEYTVNDEFWNTIEALHNMTDSYRQEELAQTIFGQSYEKLLPLIRAGREQWEAWGEEGTDLTEGQVDSLAAFYNSIESVRQGLQDTQNILSSTLAPALTEISNTFGDLVTRFNEWAQSTEGQEALSKLGEAISAVFTAFTNDIDFDAAVNAATASIESLTGALGWISDNANEVKTGLETLAAGFALLEAIKISNSIITLVKGLGGSGLAGGAAAAAGTGAGGLSTAGAAAGATAAGASFATGVSAAFAEGLLPTVGGAAFVAAPVLAVALTEMEHNRQVEETETRLREIKQKARENAKKTGKQESEAAEAISEAVEAMMPDRAVSDAFGVTSLQRTGEIDSTVAAWRERAQAKGMDFLTNRTRLQLENSDGMTSMAQHELANTIIEEGQRELKTPHNLQLNDRLSTRDLVSDMLDAIIMAEEKREESPYSPEGEKAAYDLVNRVAESAQLTDALSEGTRKQLARYVDEESGFGAGGPTQFSDALELLAQITDDYNRMFSPDSREEEYRRFMGKEYELLQAHAKELEQKKPAEPLADVVSDTLDSILQVQENLDDDLSVENIEALYSMIDQISQNKRLMDSLPETTRDMLARYADEESGFGAGSNGQFTDARQVLDTLFQDLSGVWDQLSGDGKSAGESAGDGLAAGLSGKEASVRAAAASLGAAAAKALKAALQIASPSKVMRGLGAFTGEGFALGISDSVSAVRGAVDRMASATIVRPAAFAGGYGAQAAYGPTYNSSRSIYIDKYNQYSAQDVEGIMDAIDDRERYDRIGRGA